MTKSFVAKSFGFDKFKYMATPADALTNADTINFVAITYDWRIDVDSPLVDTAKGTHTVQQLCVTKFPGTLDFSVNGTQLGFPSYPVQINLQGQDMGVDGFGRSSVEWAVNQLGINQSLPNHMLLKSIQGTLNAIISPVPAYPDMSCDGSSRLRTTHLGDSPGSKLVFAGHNTSYGVDGTMTIQNVKLYADAMEPTSFTVKIRQLKKGHDDCLVTAVYGATIEFTADVSGLPVGGGTSPSFQWGTIGAAATGPNGNQNFTVTLPNGPDVVTVWVTVSDAGNSVGASTTLTPVSPDEARAIFAFCEYAKNHKIARIPPYWYYNPGDPPPVDRVSLQSYPFLPLGARQRILAVKGTLVGIIGPRNPLSS